MLSDAQRQRMTETQARREAYLRLRSTGVEPETENFAPVRAGRSAVHPLMVVLPAAAFLGAVVLDVLHLISGSGGWATWSSGLLFVGLLASLPAAIVGALDWARITPGTRARALATWHGVTSLIALGLFASGWYFRLGTASDPGFGSILLVWSGTAILMLGGVLGGELSARLCLEDTATADEAAMPAPDVAVLVPVDHGAPDRRVAQA